MPFNVGPVELIIVLIIALLVVGPRRLPEMGNAVGKTIREFRKASTDVAEATSLDPLPKAEDTPQPNTLHDDVKPNTTTVPSQPSQPSAPVSADSKTDDD